MHRLGRWTSGIVLFARTPDARATVARSWREGRVRKLYRTLASGSCPRPKFRVEHPIGPVPYPPLGTLHAAFAEGKAASSEIHLVQQGTHAFLADVLIDTGRPHQIRIHLAAAGCPLQGDPLYAAGGRPAPDCRALPGDPGYRLHATRLSLDHPRDGAQIEIACEPPPELRFGSLG
jgi:23S rRNA pseudouridine1911/1915/1917 synthase